MTNTIGARAGGLIGLLCLGLIGASAGSEENAPATPVSVAQARQRSIEIIQTSIGFVRSKAAPAVAAEVEGRVIRMHAREGQQVKAGQPLAELDPEEFRHMVAIEEAEIARLSALIENNERTLDRLARLLKQKSASQEKVDESAANLRALRARLLGARARLARAEMNLRRTRILAPVSGWVQRRLVSEGDYLKKGEALFELARTDALQAYLPYPEYLANRFRIGLPARLRTPTAPQQRITGVITEIQPGIERSSRSIEVIVDLKNPGGWRPGASVDGEVVTAVHEQAVVIPARSLVRRPAGEVVYLVMDGRAVERKVQTGRHLDGEVEILEGVAAADTLAVDGAGYLSDGAPVLVR